MGALQEFSDVIHFNDIATDATPETFATHAGDAQCAAYSPDLSPSYLHHIHQPDQPTLSSPSCQAADGINSSSTIPLQDLFHHRALCTPVVSLQSQHLHTENSAAVGCSPTLPEWFTAALTNANKHQHTLVSSQDNSCQGHYSIRRGLQLFPPPTSNAPSRSPSPSLQDSQSGLSSRTVGSTSVQHLLNRNGHGAHSFTSGFSSPDCSVMHESAVSSSCTDDTLDDDLTASWLGDGKDSLCNSPGSPVCSSDMFHTRVDVLRASLLDLPPQHESGAQAESACLRVRQLHQCITATLPLFCRTSLLSERLFDRSASALFGEAEYEQDLSAVSQYQVMESELDCYDRDILSANAPSGGTSATPASAALHCLAAKNANQQHHLKPEHIRCSLASTTSTCEVCSKGMTDADSSDVTCAICSTHVHRACLSDNASGESWTCRQCARVDQGRVQAHAISAVDVPMQDCKGIATHHRHQHQPTDPSSISDRQAPAAAQPAPMPLNSTITIDESAIAEQPEPAPVAVKASHQHGCGGGNHKRTAHKKKRRPYGDEVASVHGEEYGGESAADGGKKVCAQCGSSTTASHQWRRGWLLQGQHVRLCNRCVLDLKHVVSWRHKLCD